MSEALVKTNTDFPWGIAIGEFATQASTPALLPTSAGGLLIDAAHAVDKQLATLVEASLLNLQSALPSKALVINVIDFSIRKRFEHLSALATLQQYHLASNQREAEQTLNQLETLVRHRHHELLNSETPTLNDYNRLGFRLEPYHVLVLNLNDFPSNRKDEQARLLTLMDAAHEAGVYVLAFADSTRPFNSENNEHAQKEPSPPFWQQLANRYPSLSFKANAAQAAAQIELANHASCQALNALKLPISLAQEDLNALLKQEIARAQENQATLKDFLSVQIGTTLDGRQPVMFNLGAKSECNNAFLVGMSGTGKTTLLNNLIVGIAEKYAADEIQLYLMDYKDGVEFQAFEKHPNCKKIFLDNQDTQAASQMLESFVNTINLRAKQCRELKVKDIDSFNAQSTEKLPRILLIADEVQRLLTDDQQGRAFNTLLKDVVKRGRAFGVHLLLSTQTLINTNIDRDTLAQISLRIAFKLNNDTDCEKIFGYSNYLPRQLEAFEFVYNADSGKKEANQRTKSLRPPEIQTRITQARLNRIEGKCLTPELVMSKNTNEDKAPANEQSKSTSATPDWLKATPASPSSKPKFNFEQILEQFKNSEYATKTEQ